MSAARVAQTVLRRFGLYYRLKASVAYDLYWRIADPRLIDAREAQVRFYRQLLAGMQPGALVFDIGANEGVKTDIFLRVGARVVAADPDEANAIVLQEKFLWRRFRPKSVVVVTKALSDKDGVDTMWIDAPGSTMNTLSLKWVQTLRCDGSRFGTTLEFPQTRNIPTTTLDHLIETYGLPYFVKIDVEGLEPAVLRGMHHPVPFLSFEVNLPEFRPEGLECVRLLTGISGAGAFNYSADNTRGFALPEWLPSDAFAEVLRGCSETNIEVFWRT